MDAWQSETSVSKWWLPVKSGLAFIVILLLWMSFIFWPGLSQFNESDWSHIELTEDEITIAINDYKQSKYLHEIGYYKRQFPFSSVETSDEQYVWMLVGRMTLIACICIAYFWKPPKDIIVAFIALNVIDLIDHLIHYNEPYFFWQSVPISYNVISIPLFALYLLIHHLSGKHDTVL